MRQMSFFRINKSHIGNSCLSEELCKRTCTIACPDVSHRFWWHNHKKVVQAGVQ
ncbi:hypothetical protein CBM2589_A70299 [Cupriavidus taiwanensis]|uniref:Uncharacterized protein n=1 Tax=Cupriavidus taiwanensis TaxID=164546 RepID=A0A975XD38_9BURK|nr:hypothetical protein CBM2589_A70299 [Cupriavidus taiwanensis]